MRITNKMMTKDFIKNYNSSLETLNDMNLKVTTGRKYMKGSEDPATAMKAYLVRQNLSRISLYQNNVSEVEGMLTEEESQVSAVNDVLNQVMGQIVQGKSDTYNADSRKSIAEVIRNYQGQIYNIMNTKYGGQYVFGGSETTTMPFTIDGANLLFQGKNVNDADFTTANQSVYYDIGLGLTTDLSGNVIPGTALDISNPGSVIFGTGTTNGMSNNVYNFLGQIATLFENNDMSQINDYMGQLQALTDRNMVTYTAIGQKNNFIDFLKTRFDTESDNATARQKALEGVDPAKAISDYNSQYEAYQAALKMGAKVLQPSLLDYMR